MVRFTHPTVRQNALTLTLSRRERGPETGRLPEGEGTEMDRLPEGNATADGQPLFRFPLAFYNGPFDRMETLQGLQ